MKRNKSFLQSIVSIRTAVRECLGIMKKVNKKILSGTILAVMLLSSFGFITNNYTLAYEVYYGDVNVGTTVSKVEAEKVYSEAKTDVKKCTQNNFEHSLSYVMTITPLAELGTTDLYREIVAAAEGETWGFAIMVNGTVVAVLQTREEAREAIDIYIDSFEREGATICASHTIVARPAVVTEFVSASEAVELIRESGLMTVSYETVLEENIEIGYKEIVIEDESIPEGVVYCSREGKKGEAEKKTVYYENGTKKQAGPVYDVVEEPVDKIIYVGTGKMAGFEKKSLPWPAEGNFTSEFGRRWGRNHNGIDIAAKTGTPIYAPAAGIVTFAGVRNGYGNYVTIDHGGGYVTTYAHMDSMSVSEGQVVCAGDKLGEIGTTGRVTGSHLHFEVLLDGVFVDPMDYIAH